MNGGASDIGRRCARWLRSGRDELGVSGRELSRLTGVSQSAISAAEGGRPPRIETLRRLLRVLPLDPRSILSGDAVAPVPASARHWRSIARLFGFESAVMRVDATVDADRRLRATVRVDGLRSTRGSLADPDRLAAVLGAPLAGAALELAVSVAAVGSPAGRRHVLRLGDVEHSFVLPARLDGGTVAYRREDLAAGAPVEASLFDQSPHGRPFRAGACAWVDHPVKRLMIRVAFAPSLAPGALAIVAWPATLATAPGERVNAWPHLYPHAPRSVAPGESGAAELIVHHPPAGTCFALAWDEACPAARCARARAVVAPARARPIGDVIRRAREDERLSRRALARRAAMSPASIVEIERGRGAGLEIAPALLAALPGLSPLELIPAGAPRGSAGVEELWLQQVRLFGLEVESETCLVRVMPSGDAAVTLRRSGIRVLREGLESLRVRLGPTRGPQTASRWDVDSIDARGGETATVRLVSRGAGPTVHELRFAAASAAHPIEHVRRVTVRGQVAVGREAPNATRDGSGRRAEAVYLEPALPARRARLEIRLPAGYWPDEIRSAVVPRACGPTWRPEDLARRLHGAGVRLHVDERRRRLVIEAERPLVGLRYQVLWFVR